MLCLIYMYLPLCIARIYHCCLCYNLYIHTHIYVQVKALSCVLYRKYGTGLKMKHSTRQSGVLYFILKTTLCVPYFPYSMSLGNRLFSTAQCPTTLLLCTLLMCFIKISRHLCLRTHLNFKYTFSQRGYHVPLLQD